MCNPGSCNLCKRICPFTVHSHSLERMLVLPVVVYDVDGVIYNIVEDNCEELGIPVPDRYNHKESSKLSAEELEKLTARYHSGESFLRLKAARGADRIFNAEKQGKAVVLLESNNFGQDVLEAKKILLARDVDNINWNNVNLYVVAEDDKNPVPQATIVVEDKPATLLKYPAGTYRILIVHRYNECELDPSFICVPSLEEAIDTVEELLSNFERGD